MPPLPPFQGTPTKSTTTNPPPPPRIVSIPTKHSRKRLPTVITDTAQLTEITLEVLESEVGRLFTYDDSSSSSHRNYHKSTAAVAADTRDAAWATADVTVQKVEAAMRGYAYRVPGTLWNRWVPKPETDVSETSSASTNDILTLQQQLLNRIYEEGYAYMSVRAMRLEEIQRMKDAERRREEGDFDAYGNRRSDGRLSMREEDSEEVEEDQSEFASLLLDADDDFNEEKSNTPQEEKNQALPPSYMCDFALPGPTVSMYDTVLDTIACSAATAADSQGTLDTANHLHDLVMMRHITDGGDATNTNPHTRPTAVTFNALIRTAAELPYSVATSDISFRDDAVTAAFSSLQAMHECGVVHRNSACYQYVLQCVHKYMPPSKIRGNIAAGVFHQARYFGLVNDAVVQAYIAANTPSNEAGIDDFIRDKLLPGQWPTKWKRESRKRRFHPREDTY
jgi:hypothetical protein